LEEQAELFGESPPRPLLGLGDVCCPEAARDRGVEEAAGLQPVEGGEVLRLARDVEVLAADHPERRLHELACDGGLRIRAREPDGLADEGVARQHADRLPELSPAAWPAAPQLVIVCAGQ